MQANQKLGAASKRRIVVIDDHPVMRVGLNALINQERDLVVIGEAGGVAEGIRVVERLLPDVAVIDLALPDGSGLDLVRRLKARHPEMRQLVCSMYDETLYAVRTLKAGAHGYVNKQQAATHVVEAIRRVLHGEIYLSREMTQRLLQSAPGKQLRTVDDLTDRELEVFSLIGRGMKTSQVAQVLHLSVKTVDSHREKIKHKLNLSSGCDLTRRAAQWVLENG